MIIEQPSKFLRWIYPKAVWRMNPDEKAVYLTFDDGPIPEATPWILDTLDRYGVKATFFMVGDNVRKHPREFQMIKERGHRLGNHTYNHIAGFRYTSRNYLANTDKADALIHSNLFRPPHGWMRWLQYMVLCRRYRVIMWDLVTRDYSNRLTADEVFDNVRRYTRNGSIITFHDSLKSIDKLQTALPRSIEWLRDQGYEFRVFD
ncbi:MAG: polysaccharide deacetylase family protein [Bacteroidaceae bacterium]|nr:polysaccharide deacetylase family protein [Bacteroidaceae bacterium]